MGYKQKDTAKCHLVMFVGPYLWIDISAWFTMKLGLCSYSSLSNECLRSACGGRLPWGHQNPFRWASAMFPKLPMDASATWCHAPFTGERNDSLSICWALFLTTRGKSHVPTVPEIPLHQPASSESVCSLCLSPLDSNPFTFLSPHSSRQHHHPQYKQTAVPDGQEPPAPSGYQKFPGRSVNQFCVQLDWSHWSLFHKLRESLQQHHPTEMAHCHKCKPHVT